MEEYERTCCNRGYHEYKVLTPLPRFLCTIAFSTAVFARRSLALADMLTTVVQDLEDHFSAWSTFELTSRVRTSSEPSRFKTAVFVCTSHVLFSCRKFTLSKFFREFNFRSWLDLGKCFNTELFPIYGIWLLSHYSQNCQYLVMECMQHTGLSLVGQEGFLIDTPFQCDCENRNKTEMLNCLVRFYLPINQASSIVSTCSSLMLLLLWCWKFLSHVVAPRSVLLAILYWSDTAWIITRNKFAF